MGIRPSAETGSGDGNQLAVDQIGEVYANVKTVADNIADVSQVADNLDQLEELGDVAEQTLTNATAAANSAAAADASADAAQASQIAAAASATTASADAATATAAVAEIDADRVAAEAAALSALASKNAAETANTNAQTAKTGAETAQTGAAASAATATTKAADATTQAGIATTKAAEALGSANAAATQAANALASANLADADRIAAEAAKTLSETAKTLAETAQAAAYAAQLAAETARDEAEAIAGGDFVAGSGDIMSGALAIEIASGTATPFRLQGGSGAMSYYKDATPSIAWHTGLSNAPGNAAGNDYCIGSYTAADGWAEIARFQRTNKKLILQGNVTTYGPLSEFGPQTGAAADNLFKMNCTNYGNNIEFWSHLGGVSQQDGYLASVRGSGVYFNGAIQMVFRVAGNAKLTTTATELTAAVPLLLPANAYGAGWNGSLKAATEDAIYDEIEALKALVVGSVKYVSTWNASTNTPAIPAAAAGNKGYYYKVSVAGATSIDGITDWKVGDWIISTGTAWEKVDNTDQVSTVNGQSGAVVLNTSHIAESGNLYFTEARARATVLTGYADGANSALAAGDSILAAFGKVQGQLNSKMGTGNSGTADLNTVIGSGSWRVEVPSANSPGFSYGQLLVIRGGGDTIAQMMFNYNNGDMAWRAGNPTAVGGAGAYSAWDKISNYAKLNSSPTFSDVTATGLFTSTGAGAGIQLGDRDGSGSYYLYDNGDVFRINYNGSSDIVFVSSTGVITAPDLTLSKVGTPTLTFAKSGGNTYSIFNDGNLHIRGPSTIWYDGAGHSWGPEAGGGGWAALDASWATFSVPLKLKNDAWHVSAEGNNRLFFANGGASYYGSPNSYHEWRGASDAVKMTLNGTTLSITAITLNGTDLGATLNNKAQAFTTILSKSASYTAADAENNAHIVMSGASRTLTLNSTPTAGCSFTCRFTTAWTISCTSLSKNGATPVSGGSVAAGKLVTFLHEGSGTWLAMGDIT